MSDSSLTPDELAKAIATAKAKGFEVVQAGPRLLLLDLDNDAARAQYQRVLPVVEEHFHVIAIDEWASKSGNRHVMLTLAESHPPGVRYGLQAALGSDGVREALSIAALLNGCDEPSILFKPAR